MSRGYVHGYDPRANERLQDQARTLVELLHWDTSYPGRKPVLEAGCGVGAQTVTLARQQPGRANHLDRPVRDVSGRRPGRDVDAAGLTQRRSSSRRTSSPCPSRRSRSITSSSASCWSISRGRWRRSHALKAVLKPGGTITVIEGDHGSTYFHPDSEAAHEAIRCQVELQRRSRRQRHDRPAALSAADRGGLRRGSRVAADGLRGCEPARSRRRLHAEDVHRDDRGRARAAPWRRESSSRSASTTASAISTRRPRRTACSATRFSRRSHTGAGRDPALHRLRQDLGEGLAVDADRLIDERTLRRSTGSLSS